MCALSTDLVQVEGRREEEFENCFLNILYHHINSEVLIGKQETTRIKVNKKSSTETPRFSKTFHKGRIHSHLGLIGVAGTHFKKTMPLTPF